MGNTSHVSNDSGTVVEQYLYDAYGTPYAYNKAGSFLGNSSQQDNHQLFHGSSAYEWLEAPGLYYCRARMYLPAHGRWLQPDPMGFAAGDVNLYRYCGNDPVDGVDPTGLYTVIGDYPLNLGIPDAMNPGHIGIATTNPTNNQLVDSAGNLTGTYGFFSTNLMSGTGAVKNDGRTPENTIVLDTTPEQEVAINKAINDAIAHPTDYAFVPGEELTANNCATFIENVLKAAGITKYDHSVIPYKLFKNLKKALKNMETKTDKFKPLGAKPVESKGGKGGKGGSGGEGSSTGGGSAFNYDGSGGGGGNYTVEVRDVEEE